MNSNIHSTAIVDKNAYIHQSVVIGPYCIVGPNVNINKDPRGKEKPSDHTPIEIELA